MHEEVIMVLSDPSGRIFVLEVSGVLGVGVEWPLRSDPIDSVINFIIIK